MKTCPTCGTEWPDDYKMCPTDGTSLRTVGTGDLVDTVVADRYHILKKLGQGGMGAVYLGEHLKIGQQVAIKVMTRALASDPDAIARFTREAKNAARIRHPNVCMVHDFGETPDGLIYLAMEFIEGESLYDLLQREGALEPLRASGIMTQCCDGLQAAHDFGIVHRDLKPENIMITKARDGSDVVKVVDFGIAKAVTGEAGQKVTQTGYLIGTPDYMSPEQVSGHDLTGQSDLYSLALVFYRMVTGALPFQGETPQDALLSRAVNDPIRLLELRPDVPFAPELQRILDRALERKRENRFETVVEFARAIQQAVGGAVTESATVIEPVAPGDAPTTAIPASELASAAAPRTATPETPQPRPGPRSGKGGRRIAVAASVVVVVGAAAVVWQTTSGDPDTTTVPETTVVQLDSASTDNASDTVGDERLAAVEASTDSVDAATVQTGPGATTTTTTVTRPDRPTPRETTVVRESTDRGVTNPPPPPPPPPDTSVTVRYGRESIVIARGTLESVFGDIERALGPTLAVDTVTPLATERVARADSILQGVLRFSNDPAIRTRVASAYQAFGRRLVLGRAHFAVAAHWLQRARAAGLPTSGTAANQFFLGLAYFFQVPDLDETMRAQQSCALLTREARLLADARRELTSGRATNPDVANDMLGFIRDYEQGLPQYRSRFGC